MIKVMTRKRLRKIARREAEALRRQAKELLRARQNKRTGSVDALQVGIELLRIQRKLQAIGRAFPPRPRIKIRGLQSRSDFGSCSGDFVRIVRG
jgi:hypothetical protein